jgi:cytochrome c peroxidase
MNGHDKCWLIGVGALVVVGLLSLPLSNYVLDTKRSQTPLKSPMQQVYPKAVAIMQAKCFACHVPNIKKPWYAVLPVADTLIDEHIVSGLSHLNMADAFAKEPAMSSKNLIKKMSRVLNNGTMPPASYTVLHWTTQLSEEDKTVLRDWVAALKQARANNPNPAD